MQWHFDKKIPSNFNGRSKMPFDSEELNVMDLATHIETFASALVLGA